MQNDRTTLRDLYIYPGEPGLFPLIDRTTTQAGHRALQQWLFQPPGSFESLRAAQEVIVFFFHRLDRWTRQVTNGTIVMLEKFFESADHAVSPPSSLNLLFSGSVQRLLNKTDYFFTKFSLSHLTDFFKGCLDIVALEELGAPGLLQAHIRELQGSLSNPLVQEVLRLTPETPYREIARLQFRVRRQLKQTVYAMIGSYALIDAWQGLARATAEHGWPFPELVPAQPVCLEAEGIFHPLVSGAVPYDIRFRQGQNFLILTGANMSGKTTFMRTIGVCALLGHLGMGVPARRMRLSFLQGIITNMHVEDNLLNGESYFFAEVKRMRQSAERIVSSDAQLVLMDELFKGTNVHDAYECTRAVVDGLIGHSEHILIVSTHLYEVAEYFSSAPQVQFAYFVTHSGADRYEFTYELKAGISNDRIGYRILQQEGVIDLLRKKNRANE